MEQRTKRQTVLHEIVEKIDCLHDGLKEGQKLLHDDIRWREEEAKPVLVPLRRLLWVITGATGVATVLLGMVIWMFSNTYKSVEMNSKTLAATVEILKHIEKDNDRQDQMLRDMLQRRK